MKKHIDMGTLVKRQLLPYCKLRPLDIGRDADLSAKGFSFHTESYEIDGIGHLCIMTMKAMAGLMKMETAVVSPLDVDLPLLNLDWVSAFGKETQLVELYDTQLAPCPQDMLDRFDEVKRRDSDLKDYETKESRPYDDLLYPESYCKTDKGASARFCEAADEYMSIFTEYLRKAGKCSRDEKAGKVRNFTDMLITAGGPAVNQMTKLFGQETAERVIRSHMYGV